MVFDTEVLLQYRRTVFQVNPTGAIAQFAAAGKETKKKIWQVWP
jgi:hypothetical protein